MLREKEMDCLDGILLLKSAGKSTVGMTGIVFRISSAVISVQSELWIKRGYHY